MPVALLKVWNPLAKDFWSLAGSGAPPANWSKDSVAGAPLGVGEDLPVVAPVVLPPVVDPPAELPPVPAAVVEPPVEPAGEEAVPPGVAVLPPDVGAALV